MSQTRFRVVFFALVGAIAAPALVASLSVAKPKPAGASSPPPTIVLTGTVRDFRERTKPGGHPDFEVGSTATHGNFAHMVETTLGPDRKPVYKGNALRVASHWRDSANRNICWCLYDPSHGDKAGTTNMVGPGAVKSAASFASWYNDDLNYNVSQPLSLTLVRQPDGNYVFDSQTDPVYKAVGGFFPIENQMFGNPGGNPNRNFHFTFELHTKFTYDASAGQVFGFRGDDDVWVFIDGKMVIDLGGLHPALEQFVDISRLGLVDGETYELSFFFAERHRTQSNFKVTTNLQLETLDMPTASTAFD
jgi:fibro-slime domain-containing protein